LASFLECFAKLAFASKNRLAVLKKSIDFVVSHKVFPNKDVNGIIVSLLLQDLQQEQKELLNHYCDKVQTVNELFYRLNGPLTHLHYIGAHVNVFQIGKVFYRSKFFVMATQQVFIDFFLIN